MEPLPYHRAVVAHLKKHQPAVWRHFAQASVQGERTEAIRLQLLQQTYALSRAANAELYEIADDVAKTLELGVPVELFHGEGDGLNAALHFSPDTARVVLHGPMEDALAPDEMRCLLGHELAHHRFWTIEDRAFLVADRALHAMAEMGSVSATEAMRLFRLTTEVLADRAGLQVTDRDTAIRTLVKVRTHRRTVVASDFLAQSEELLAATGAGSREWSHPEAHLRALCVARYAADAESADAGVRTLLEGVRELDQLDVLGRDALSMLSQRLVSTLLAPEWMRTTSMLAHCRLLFDEVPSSKLEPLAARDLDGWGESVLDYLCALLLDFTVMDAEIADVALLRAHAVAEGLELEERYEDALYKHLKRTRKSIGQSLKKRDQRLAEVDE